LSNLSWWISYGRTSVKMSFGPTISGCGGKTFKLLFFSFFSIIWVSCMGYSTFCKHRSFFLLFLVCFDEIIWGDCGIILVALMGLDTPSSLLSISTSFELVAASFMWALEVSSLIFLSWGTIVGYLTIWIIRSFFSLNLEDSIGFSLLFLSHI